MKIRICFIFILCIALFIPRGLIALDPAKPLESFRIDRWTDENGFAPGPVISIRQTRDGYLWTATPGALVRYDGSEFKTFDLKGTPPSHKKFTTPKTFIDSKGQKWIGTLRDGLSIILDGKTEKIPIEGFNENYAVYCIYEDSGGSLWVGTSKGLLRVKKDPAGKTVIQRTLLNDHILSLFEDREKNLWIGTRNSGLKCLKDTVFITHTIQTNGHSNEFRCIYEDREGNIWAGSRYGKLYRFVGDLFIEVPLKPDIFDKAMFILGEDNEGNLLLGTEYRGLFRLKDGNAAPVTMKDGPVEGTITAIHHDRRNRLWVSRLQEGLGYYEEGNFYPYIDRKDSRVKMVFTIFEDGKGNILIGFGEGLHFLENGDCRPAHVKKYLEGVPVSSINEDADRNILVGTYGQGLKRFDTKKKTFDSYTGENGLGSDSIYGVLEDDHGSLWMASPKGVLKVRKEELDNFTLGKTGRINCITFGLSDGLNSIKCSVEAKNSAVKTRNGEFLFATGNGISAVNPAKVRINRVPPIVLIENVLVNGKEHETNRPGKPGFHLNNVDVLEFHFHAMTFPRTGNAVFKYKLEGIDGDWRYASANGKNTARYTHLPKEGKFTFRVSASNSHGVWTQKDVSVSFYIKQVFTQSPAFFLLASLFLVFIAAAYVILKKNPFKKIQKYQKTKLDPGKAENYRNRIIHLMEKEKIYRDRTISVQSLAEKLSIPQYHLSQVINEKFNKNFFDLINAYRIEEAKDKLTGRADNGEKILKIAYDLGFNSLTSFNRVFKKHTGKTPTQYKKMKKE